MTRPDKLEVKADKESSVEASVWMTNEGSSAVEIREITTSCGCTIPKPLSRSILNPGETTEVVIKVQPMSFGSKSSTLKVMTNSEHQPAIVIPVMIQGPPLTPPYVRHAPSTITQAVIPKAEDSTIEFAVTCIEEAGRPNWFKGCACSLKGIVFSSPEVVQELVLDNKAVQREYRVIAKIDGAQLPSESVSDRVELKVESDSMRPLPEVIIRLTRSEAVRCIPAALFVKHSGRPVKVVIRSEDSEEFTIKDIHASDERIVVQCDQSQTSHTHVIDVSLPQRGSGSSERVNVTTSHSKCDHVIVRYCVAVRIQRLGGRGWSDDRSETPAIAKWTSSQKGSDGASPRLDVVERGLVRGAAIE